MKIKILESIVENSINGYIVFQQENHLVYANRKAKEMFPENHGKHLWRLALSHMEEGQEEELRYEIGDAVYRIRVMAEPDERGIILEIRQCNNDNWLPFINKILDKSGDLMFYKDASLTYRYTNQTFKKFFHKEDYQIIGNHDEEVMENNSIKEQCAISDRIALETGSYSGVEKVGEKYYNVMKERINGGILCIAKNITKEITEYKKATTDILTGLHNRRIFNTVIHDIYNNNEDGYYLAIIDVDDFRLINNQFGHLMGDQCLRQLGERLNMYDNGQFFRIGGDEFVGLIKNKKNQVITLMKNIQQKLWEDDRSNLTLSIGIKKLDLTVSYEENYRLADQMLYEAKGKGKNQFCIYE